jgi:hypothetical protein
MSKLLDILEKVKKTLSLAQPFVIGGVSIWTGADIGLYVVSGVALIISAIDYVELFVKK